MIKIKAENGIPMRQMLRTSLAVTILSIYACSPTRYVVPLEKGEKEVTAHFGGPMVNFAGASIPIPLTTVGYGQGLGNGFTAFGDLHITAATFGVFQTELGLSKTWFNSESKSWGFTASPRLNFAMEFSEFRTKLWPQLDGTLFKQIGSDRYIYGGYSGWFELAGTRAHGEPQPNQVLNNVHLGILLPTKARKYSYQFELKYIALGIDNQYMAPSYVSAGNSGAFGIYFNLKRKLTWGE